MKYLALILMTIALLAAAPAAEASCHECVDDTVEFVECTLPLDGNADAEACGEDYANSVLFHDH